MIKGYINNREYYLAVFNSRNHAISVYYKLEKKGYGKFQLISTPCRLSQGCSYSIKFNKFSDFEHIKNEVQNLENIIDSVYIVKNANGRKIYKKLVI